MRKIIQRCGAAGLAPALAGCGLLGAPGTAAAPAAGPPVSISQDTLPSVLVAVLDGEASWAALSGLVNATARSSEELTVLQAGAPPKIILSSASPPPTMVVVPGKPTAPPGGQTSYEAALYADRLKHWRGEVTAARSTEAAAVRDSVAGWLRGLSLPARIGQPADPAGPATSLAAESAAAASALAGLAEEHGNVFGSRRVVLLYTGDLVTRPPAGELAGDTVFVITRSLPSAALNVSAVAQLTALLPQLREAGVTALINGFASTPGTALANYSLSYDRASAVASFFESRGVPTPALIIVGHGASDLVAAGNSGANRRVTVVIERPS